MEKHYNTLKELHNAFDAATTEEQKNAIRADYKKFEKELESQGRPSAASSGFTKPAAKRRIT